MLYFFLPVGQLPTNSVLLPLFKMVTVNIGWAIVPTSAVSFNHHNNTVRWSHHFGFTNNAVERPRMISKATQLKVAKQGFLPGFLTINPELCFCLTAFSFFMVPISTCLKLFLVDL
jgi:hypothetical protein